MTQHVVAGAIHGSYRLVRRLGAGASGQVWVGRHVLTGGTAAVKLLQPRRARELHKLMLAREGRTLLKLTHPHVVRLFEIGPEHIATTFVDGSDLERRIRGGITPAEAIRIATQVGSALAQAHALGIVHRDVKPANILIDRNGNAFLGDFGLALVGDDPESQAIAGGTPIYMPPEQARGEPAGPAADQFALARTLMEALAGGTGGAPADQALAQLPASAAPLREILRVATLPAPHARWPSMNELVQRIGSVELREQSPAVKLAPARHASAAWGWSARAHRVAEVAPAITRADFRLGDLESAGALPAAACAQFRAATGYRDFAWSLYARADRLGPIGPSMLSRASELVVLLHGFATTREVWHDVALALCRDQADALVIAPDVNGFGESPFVDAPTTEQLTPASLGAAVVRFVQLLGMAELPTVMVGHSMSALALVTLDPSVLGERTSRVTITPALLELVWPQRTMARFGAALLRLSVLLPFVHRLLGWLMSLPWAAPGLGRELLQSMKRQFLSVPPAILSRLVRAMANTRVPSAALRGVDVIFGAHDPTVPRRAADQAVARFGGNDDRVHRMASGGHYPHLPVVDHPEWAARNQDELVRIIGSVLLSSVGGPLPSTLASTPDPGVS